MQIMVGMKIIVKIQPRTNIRNPKRNGNDNYLQYNIFDNYSSYNIFRISNKKCQNPKKSASMTTHQATFFLITPKLVIVMPALSMDTR